MKTLLLVLASTSVWAQVEVRATLDRARIGTDDVVRVEFEVVGPPSGGDLRFATNADFTVQGSSTTSTSRRTADGGSMQREARSFSLRPTHAGSLTVPAATWVVRDGSFTSKTLHVEVQQGHVTGARLAKRNEPIPSKLPNARGDAFLDLVVDHETVLLGEPFELELIFYTRADVLKLSAITFPTLRDAVVDDLSPAKVMPVTVVLEGVPFHAVHLGRKRVVPLSIGAFHIAPGTLELEHHQLTSQAASVAVNSGDERATLSVEEARARLAQTRGLPAVFKDEARDFFKR